MSYKTWVFGNIEVHYTDALDGDGSSMAEMFVDYIKTNYGHRLPFECAFEWCAGPGFIGFALLSEKICKRLVLADINAKAVEAARSTVYHNGLDDLVTVYQGDNLAAIAAHEKFDLVVGNPPNYYCINPAHPAHGALSNDLRPSDPHWNIHRAFYESISSFLREDAVLCIEEVDPYATKCFLPNGDPKEPLWGPEPFDIRPRPPIDDFVGMISKAGLEYINTVRLPHPAVPVHLMVSHWDGSTRSTNRFRLVPDVTFAASLTPNANGMRAILAIVDKRVKGSLKYSASESWVPKLFEIICRQRESVITLSKLADELNVDPKQLAEVITGMRSNGWIT